MPKRIEPMHAYQLRRIKTPGIYAVGVVAGLYLDRRSDTSQSWILRVTFNGARPELGLGSYPEISLEAARDIAREWKQLLRQGIDPREKHRKESSARRAESMTMLTFEDAAEECWQAKSKEFGNVKHSEQWIRTIRQYANPTIGKMYVTDIQRAHVLKVLQPIWETVTDTASKLRGRIETVISYAYALREITDRKNPAAWVDGLDALLPSAQTLTRKKDKHHPALPWQRLPVLLRRVAAKKGMGARALELQIETTSRGIEVRGARWPEIDFKKKTWTVPAGRMKNKKLHTVPLSDAQLDRLRSLPRMDGCDLIFHSSKGTMVSDATIGKVIKDLHEADVNGARMDKSRIDAAIKAGHIGFLDPIENKVASPHGTARSSFKDWVRNNIGHKFGDEVSELCLAHVNSDTTRAAYARDELIDLRRLMLSEWVMYLNTPTITVENPTHSANAATMPQGAIAA